MVFNAKRFEVTVCRLESESPVKPGDYCKCSNNMELR